AFQVEVRPALLCPDALDGRASRRLRRGRRAVRQPAERGRRTGRGRRTEALQKGCQGDEDRHRQRGLRKAGQAQDGRVAEPEGRRRGEAHRQREEERRDHARRQEGRAGRRGEGTAGPGRIRREERREPRDLRPTLRDRGAALRGAALRGRDLLQL
ncbi:MAG: hypothetical protein AVDCRST_MAG02-4712, partial [uncultured Rubrobacteraceae bacterium]